MRTLTPLTPEQHAEMEFLCEASKAKPEAQALAERYHPEILDRMQQAHDCLGLMIRAYQKDSGVPGIVAHGYCLQFYTHIEAAGALETELVTELIKIIQKEEQ